MGYLFADDDENQSSVLKGLKEVYSDIKEIVRSNTTSEGIMKVMNEMDGVYSRLSKSMGLGRESAVAIKASLGDAYSDVAKLGGKMTDIESIQKGLVSALGTNVIATKEVFTDIYAAAKVMGVEGDALSKTFIDAGYNMHNIGEETKKIMDTARSLGVSAKAVSSAVLANMEELDTHNFAGGVEGLAKMAATSAGLRVNMSTILASVDKAFNPEGAIEMAAAFQRLGVSQSELLDPMRLMNMSQNDPEAFQQSIAKMGASLTELDEKGNVKIAPGSIRRMKELARAADIPQAEFAKMSKAAAEMDIKMSKIKFPEFATEEQKTMLANVTQMKDGVMKINIDGKMTDLNDALKSVGGNKEAFEKLIKDNQPKSNEELLQEQLTVSEKIAANTESLRGKTGYALSGTKTGEDFMNTSATMVKVFTDSINKGMDISTMRENLNEDFEMIGDTINKVFTGDAGLGEVIGGSLKIIGKVGSDLLESGKKMVEEFNNQIGILKTSGNDIVKGTINVVEYGYGVVKQSENFGNPINTNFNDTESNINKIVEYQKNDGVNMKNEVFHSGNLNLDLNVKVPNNMDKATFDNLMRTPEFKEAILELIYNSPTYNNKSNVPSVGN